MARTNHCSPASGILAIVVLCKVALTGVSMCPVFHSSLRTFGRELIADNAVEGATPAFSDNASTRPGAGNDGIMTVVPALSFWDFMASKSRPGGTNAALLDTMASTYAGADVPYTVFEKSPTL